MADYRDYGSIYGAEGTGVLTAVNTTRLTQVYKATHIGEGKRLPLMERSFISFTYGGKSIEDFNLIATILDNRLGRNGYADFTEITSTYSGLNGLQFYGMNFNTNTLSLTLVTDEMELKMLDDFLHWFIAGETRELILAEHPNRGILARVKTPPVLDLLPFEKTVEITISGYTYPTKTTNYKGSIKLEFVMDLPHWYSIVNILGEKVFDEGSQTYRYVDEWKDFTDPSYPNGKVVSVFASLDALKILYEDGIPLGSMFDNNMLLGNGAYASVEERPEYKIWDPVLEVGARIVGSINDTPYIGVIAGAIVDASDKGITTLASNLVGYFYYSGTAPAPTIISFTLTPEMLDYYIVSPFNSHTETKYNTITILSKTTQYLQFTTPNLLTSYNKAVDIYKDILSDETPNYELLRSRLRDEVRHAAVRKWAINVLDYVKDKGAKSNALKYLSYFIRSSDETDECFEITFSFNSYNGEATGTFSYRTMVYDSTDDNDTLITTADILSDLKEDVGDMLRSNYITIVDRNTPSDKGRIVSWTEQNPQYSHRILHDVSKPLKELLVLYKNMYL